jgi:hypothetical protein
MRKQILIFIVIIFIACDKNEPVLMSEPNSKLPVANAGYDFSITLPDETCWLDGNNFLSRPTGYLTFIWRELQTRDLLEFYKNEATGKSSPVFLQAGKYNFELMVKNAFGEDADTVSVDVTWAPQCNAERELISGGKLIALDSEIDSIPFNTAISSGNGKLIFAGGTLNDVDPFWGNSSLFLSTRLVVFDPSTRKQNVYTLGTPRLDVVTAVVDDLIFIAGGYVNSGLSNVVEILDKTTGKIKSRQLAYPRDGMKTAVLGHTVFFAGGYSKEGNISDIVEIYDVDTDSWFVTRLSVGRSNISCVVADDKVYFAGGYAAIGGMSDVVDVYESNSGSWTILKLSEKKADAQGANFDGQVVFAGGGNEVGKISKTIDFFDPRSGTRSQDCLVLGSTSLSIPFGHIPSILGKANRLYVNDGGHLAYFDKISRKWFYSVDPGTNFPMFLNGNSIYTYEKESGNGSSERYRIYRFAD